ncbi:ParA family protein [Bacteroides ovatus]|nr:ParA family protein [Bacteroides ovatus]
MTQCHHSSLVRRTASPQNRIRDDPFACLFTETDNAEIQSAYKQKIKSSTIKINGTMSKEIFVAFATQKGGIGKSTVTALAASYLHNVKGYNVAVVDCDDPQHSIHGLREHEMRLIDSSTYFKALACDHFRKIKKNAYTIVKSNAVNALDDAERMIATEDVKPDVVFFDMPGTLRSNGVIKTLSQMDYIFTPLSADRFVVESTLKFVTMFRDRLMTTGQAKTKGLHLFWTMVDGRERNDLYGIYEEVIAEMGFPVLSTRLPDSKKFRRDLSEERKSVFRSTIFPMDTALLKGSGIREFSEEISDIIRPQ